MNAESNRPNGSGSHSGSEESEFPFTQRGSVEAARPDDTPLEEEDKDSLAKRMRLAIERNWEEASKLGETFLDFAIIPPSGFAATAIAWMVTCVFFVFSLVVGGILALGAVVLFVGLEFLAALAYAYPATMFLLSVAGGIAPPLILYWAIHMIAGIEGHWSTWAFYPAILTGLWGSYYYWRFGRVIATTGDGVMAFYRGAAPKAGEIFGLPFLVLSGVWDVVKVVFGIFRGITRELLKLLMGSGRKPAGPPPSATGAPGAPGNGPSGGQKPNGSN